MREENVLIAMVVKLVFVASQFFEAFENFNGKTKDNGVVGAIVGIFNSLKSAESDGATSGHIFHGFLKVD